MYRDGIALKLLRTLRLIILTDFYEISVPNDKSRSLSDEDSTFYFVSVFKLVKKDTISLFKREPVCEGMNKTWPESQVSPSVQALNNDAPFKSRPFLLYQTPAGFDC